MTCFRCGAATPEGARFCPSCGTAAVDPHEATLLIETEDPEALLHRVRMVLAGEYDVECELARGGMGVIFKATEVGLRRAVALKVLPPELGLSVKTAERFKREARMVAELDHPNIIPVYRIGHLGGIFFIAMKFIEGRSLGLIVDTQGALPVPVALHVLRGAARALAYAHDRSIVHRDIKGANILLFRQARHLTFAVAVRPVAAARVDPLRDDTVRDTRFTRGAVLWRAGRVAESRAIFAALAARDTGINRMRDIAQFGITSAKLGDRAAARRAERALASANPPYQRGTPKLLQAEIAAALGEPERAVRLLQQGLALGLGLESRGGALVDNSDLEPLLGYPPFEELLRPTG